MDRRTFDPLETLSRNWQVLLIASLPGSLLRIWAVLSAPDGVAGTPGADALPLIARLWLWSATHGLATLLTFPLLHGDRRARPRGLPREAPRPRGTHADRPRPEAPKPLRLDALSTSARELLAAVSRAASSALVPRLGGAAVVAVGDGPRRRPRVPQHRRSRGRPSATGMRWRSCERAGVVERDGETRRLTAHGLAGRPAAHPAGARPHRRAHAPSDGGGAAVAAPARGLPGTVQGQQDRPAPRRLVDERGLRQRTQLSTCPTSVRSTRPSPTRAARRRPASRSSRPASPRTI